MTTELLPCPFCGTDEFLMLSNSLLGEHSFWQVECGCHASGAPEVLRENAIKVWNSRPLPDGYAIVPVDPTEAMVEIAPHHDRDDMASYREIYRAMINAAQAPRIMPPPMRDSGPLESEEGE